MTPRAPILLALLVAGCIPPLPDLDDPCAPWEKAGLFRYRLDVNGKTRHSYVYVPPDTTGPRDLVFVLHGAGDLAREFADTTRYIQLARQEGFVAVIPEGIHPLFSKTSWNAGECCRPADEAHTDQDDVAFLTQLTDQLEERTCSDRVLATGFSNGAMLTYRWVCTNDRVDVHIPAGGVLAWDGVCRSKPTPFRHYHGTEDPKVPLEGKDPYGPVLEQIRPRLEQNQCASLDPVSRYTEGPMTCDVYDCAVATEVCLIDGWKHKWPGGRFAPELGGIDATRDGWAFFLEHAPPRPGSTPTSTPQGSPPAGGSGI